MMSTAETDKQAYSRSWISKYIIQKQKAKRRNPKVQLKVVLDEYGETSIDMILM